MNTPVSTGYSMAPSTSSPLSRLPSMYGKGLGLNAAYPVQRLDVVVAEVPIAVRVGLRTTLFQKEPADQHDRADSDDQPNVAPRPLVRRRSLYCYPPPLLPGGVTGGEDGGGALVVGGGGGSLVEGGGGGGSVVGSSDFVGSSVGSSLSSGGGGGT